MLGRVGSRHGSRRKTRIVTRHTAAEESPLDGPETPAEEPDRRSTPARRAARRAHQNLEVAPATSRVGNPTYRLTLAAAFATALTIRLGYVAARWHVGMPVTSDQYWYQTIGHFLLDGKGMSNPLFYVKSGKLYATALHGPFTAILFVPFDAIGIGSFHAHQIVIAVIGAATVLVLARLATELAGRFAGILTAFVGAAYPGLWIFDAKVMSEPVEQFLVSLTLLAAYRIRSRFTIWRALALGALIALDTLTRSELLLFVPLLLVPLAVGWWRQEPRSAVTPGSQASPANAARARRALSRCAAILAVTGMVLAPWIAFCETAFSQPEVLSTALGIGIVQDNNATVYAGPLLGTWYSGPTYPQVVADESQLDNHYRTVGIDYAKAHRDRLPVVLGARLGRVWFAYRPEESAQLMSIELQSTEVTQAWIWSFYALVLVGVVGAVSLRRNRRALYPLLGTIVIVTAVALGEAGVLRFRAPFEVAFVVLVGVGLDAVGRAILNRLPHRGAHRTHGAHGFRNAQRT